MWLLLLLCLFSLEPGQGAFIKHERTGRNELRARMGLLGLDQGFLPDFNHPDVDEHCKNHFNFFLQDLTSENASTWSMLMADASGKIPAGYLYGNVYSLGNFDECLKVSVNSESGYEFLGKHCLAQIFFTGMKDKTDGEQGHQLRTTVGQRWAAVGPLSAGAGGMSSGLGQASLFEIGLCIPSTCSSSDLRASLDEAVKNYSLASNVLSCDDASHKALSPAEIGVTIMFAIIGLYLLAGTVLDIYQRISCNKQLQGNTRKILIAGSILTNGERILSTKTRKDNIGCLNGIRFITMTWVVLGHVYSFKLISIPAVNPISYIEMVNDWKFMAIVNAVVSVDTFFFLSGLLVTYLLLKELDRNKGRFNIFRFYFHRYIRLTPALALLIAFTTVYMSRLRSGPYYFNLHQFLTKACEDYWWRNLLYINNLFKQEEMCAAHTWYMANDMQMYIISPLFIFPLFMWPVWGVCLAVVGTALSALATVLVMKTYDLPGTTTGYDVMHPLPNTNNFDLFYVKPWMRLGPYLIGILTGYLLHRMKKTGFRFPKGTAVWGWAMATACNLAVLYGIYGYMPLDSPQMPRDLQLTYNALFRIAWACGVAWVVLACAAGSGGSIDALLSWKAFIPLGRLTYSAYLTHVYILPWFWWSTKTSVYFDHETQVIDFLATVIIIHATAFILTLIGESPILVLEKTFLFPGESKPATTKQNGAETVHEEGVTEAGIGNEGSVDAEVHEKGLVKDGMDNKGYVDEDRGKTNGFPT